MLRAYEAEQQRLEAILGLKRGEIVEVSDELGQYGYPQRGDRLVVAELQDMHHGDIWVSVWYEKGNAAKGNSTLRQSGDRLTFTGMHHIYSYWKRVK